MKILLLFVSFFVLSTSNSFAMEADAFSSLDTGIEEFDFSDRTSESRTRVNRGYVCNANTTCWNGRRIACSATGVSCNVHVVHAQSVYCEAYGADGRHVWASDRC